MTGGGLSPHRKGAAMEVAVMRDQEAKGRWCKRLRQGGGECVDLLSLERCRDCTENKSCSLGLGVHHAFVIQVKARKVGKRADPLNLLSPAERMALITEAKALGATALVAWKADGQIQYREVKERTE